MNLVFLCGCLEPGQDGVGDYTRKLASELIKQGHQISAISLNDSFTDKIIINKVSKKLPGFSIFRLPAKLNKYERFDTAKKWISECDPDWISLQFVIYSYHSKGLPLDIANLFSNVAKNRKWHIMFHEIWIGISDKSSLKQKVIGLLQRNIILSIVKSLKPTVCTTSNALYKIFLEKIDIQVSILPLFSNISIAQKKIKVINNLLEELNIKTETELINWRLSGSFGTIRREINLEQILEEQYLFSLKQNLKLAFIAFGKIGSEGVAEFNRLKYKLNHIKFVNLGEQSEENISTVMQLLDISISGTPLSYLGKSGVFSSMKFHDVDVIIHRDKQFPQHESKLNEYLSEIAVKKSEEWGVSNIAQEFLGLLNKFNY